MKERSEIEEKYKWDLSKFCKSDEEFYSKLDSVAKKAESFKVFEGKLANDDVLFEFLEKKTEFLDKDLNFTSYAFYRQCEDATNRSANEMMEKRSIVMNKIVKIFTPIEVEIDKFSVQKLKRLANEERFKNYKRFFETTIRHKAHSLSKKEEVLLSCLGEFTGGYSDNFDKFNDADLKFSSIKDSKGKKHELNHSNYTLYAQSEDRTLRKNAFKEVNGKRGEFINFLATNYISEVKENCTFAKIRKYKSALSASLYGEEVDAKVYNMLVKKVRENVSVVEEYFEIKRKMLNLDKIAVYDTFAPIVKEDTKKYSYEQAVELVKEAVTVLGKDYVSLVDKAVKERWIDVMPNKNKYSGAFSSGNYGVTPVVLLNFEGDIGSVFTLAHELGHAMHSYHSNQNQPSQTADYVIFVAEVASITNEMLLLNLLLKKAKNNQEKMSLYDYFLREVRSTIFRQTMFAEFEQFAHETYEKEEPLSSELLCEKYQELNNFYHGKKVVQIPEMKYEWARIPHFFDSFYVYKYATGMISAIEISNHILSDENFAKKYIKFLSSGCTQDPISLLKIADCDLGSEKVYDDAFAVCRDFIENWKTILK
ncbi:MAG: oligoendopeptidase F [Candidatus Caccovivens sp.]